jgi:beta-N-acetylhexosaminidase
MKARVGELLIIGFDGIEMSAGLMALLKRVQPAGVILFARNIAGAAQTQELLRACQALVSTPMFLCVDLEGGEVDRFRSVLGPAPSAADVFATGDQRLFRKHGCVIGESCRVLGFNTDFAPALDLAFEASRSVMSSRAVSQDPKKVVSYAREFLQGLHAAGVLGAGKHFPGLGEGNLDSHHDLPVIEKAWKKLWDEDLVPYRVLRRDLPFVMISHAAYPGITKDHRPASLSKKWITDILRKKIGYRGLVVSDDLEMGGVQAAMPTPQAAVEHIRAGGDIALICHKEEFVSRAHEALIKEAERDRKFAARVAESVKRVELQKQKFLKSIRWNARSATKRVAPDAVGKLSRQLWEFGEQVRLEAIGRRQEKA